MSSSTTKFYETARILEWLKGVKFVILRFADGHNSEQRQQELEAQLLQIDLKLAVDGPLLGDQTVSN
jgi:hypothetical protein